MKQEIFSERIIMTTLQPLTPLQILPPEQANTIIEAVNIGATVPGTGNFTALTIPNATSSNQAVALGQITGSTASLSPNFVAINPSGPNFSINYSGGVSNFDALTNSWRANGTQLIFNVSGTEKARISTNGNFLIHTITDNGVDALQATGSATFSSTVSASNIVAGQTVTITQPVSGTVYQNINDFPIDIYAPITYSPTGSAAATCAVALDSSATPATPYTNSEPLGLTSGSVMTDHLTVPPKWYYSYTVANATIGTVNARAGAR